MVEEDCLVVIDEDSDEGEVFKIAFKQEINTDFPIEAFPSAADHEEDLEIVYSSSASTTPPTVKPKTSFNKSKKDLQEEVESLRRQVKEKEALLKERDNLLRRKDEHIICIEKELAHFREEEGKSGKIMFLCPHEGCGKTVNKRGIYRHMKNHEEATIPCLKCGKLFKRQSALKSHEVTHRVYLAVPSIQCELCGQRLYTEKGLKYHLKMQHGK